MNRNASWDLPGEVKPPVILRRRHFRARQGVSLFLALLLCGCGSFTKPNFDKQDRGAGLSREDYQGAMKPRAPEGDGSATPPPIPQSESLTPMPNLALPANARLVSISVNEEVPLRDVLVELAQQANVGLELDPHIAGALIFSVRQRPFEEVIDRIADMAGLRYNLNGNVLRIEKDTPYLRDYRVDYLNVIRNTESSVSTTVDVVGGEAVGGEGGGQGNSSESQVSSQSQNNFWQELETNLSMMMRRTEKRENLLTAANQPGAEDIAYIPPPPPAIPEPIPVTPPSAATAQGAAAAGAGPAQGAGALIQATNNAITAAAGGASSAPGATDAAATPAAAAADDTKNRPFAINRMAGLVTVFGTERQHQMIEGYLRKLRRTIAGQVLIEAKVLEVQLSDGFESGINWAGVLGTATGAARFGTTVVVPQSIPFNGLDAATPGVVTLALDQNDLDGAVNLVHQFGTVRTLSSPRLTVQHNQTAVLKVVENRVFFELDFERTTEGVGVTRERVTVDSNIRTVPEGVIITVQPSIHGETEEIAMSLRPTITRITGTVNDPGVAIASNNTVQSPVPIIAVQEIDSMVTVRSGRVLVMGGLMQDSGASLDAGIPGASNLPILGNLFKSRSDQNRQSELVIFIRATILEGSGAAPADVELYEKFGRDRRPLKF